MPKLKSPTNRRVVCHRCGQGRGTLNKIDKGVYAHSYNCPKPLPKPIKLVMPTTEEVLAVKKTKEE